MRFFYVSLGLFFLAIINIACIESANKRNLPLLSKKGVLQILDWPWQKESLVLSRGWDFYWQQLWGPAAFARPAQPKPTARVNLPHLWTAKLTGKDKPGHGYATYRLQLKLDQKKSLFLYVKRQQTAYKVWVNGAKVAQAGVVARGPRSVARYYNQVVPLPPKLDQYEIIVQIANYQHQKGGFVNSILLGTKKQILAQKFNSEAGRLFLYGSLFVLAIYYFMVYIFRPQEKSYLLFALLVLIVIVHFIALDDNVFLSFIPHFPWGLLLRVSYFTSMVGLLLFMALLQELFAPEFHPVPVWGLAVLTFAYLMAIIFMPISLVSQSIIFLRLIYTAYFCYIVANCGWALVHRREGALLLSLGVIILGGTLVYEFWFLEGFSQRANIINQGVFFFCVTIAVILAMRILRSHSRTEYQLEGFLLMLAGIIESRENYTSGHIKRVSEYCKEIARRLRLPDSEVHKIYLGAMVHDVAKLSVKEMVLEKNHYLTEAEFEEAKKRTVMGHTLLQHTPDVEGAALIALYLEERWDGSGYPQKLKREQIPLDARIVRLVDDWDNLTLGHQRGRPHKLDNAIEQMIAERGRIYDPGLCDLFFNDRYKIYKKFIKA
jgi:HD-GYP domain-containing protein (c-di-GMP phosphodiesterase class II)